MVFETNSRTTISKSHFYLKAGTARWQSLKPFRIHESALLMQTKSADWQIGSSFQGDQWLRTNSFSFDYQFYKAELSLQTGIDFIQEKFAETPATKSIIIHSNFFYRIQKNWQINVNLNWKQLNITHLQTKLKWQLLKGFQWIIMIEKDTYQNFSGLLGSIIQLHKKLYLGLEGRINPQILSLIIHNFYKIPISSTISYSRLRGVDLSMNIILKLF